MLLFKQQEFLLKEINHVELLEALPLPIVHELNHLLLLSPEAFGSIIEFHEVLAEYVQHIAESAITPTCGRLQKKEILIAFNGKLNFAARMFIKN